MSPNARETLELRGIAVSKSASGFDVELPRSLKAERRGDIAVLFLARAEKRNAIDDPTVFGKAPVVAVLHGAVVGGGLEIAAACHIRVAEASAYYALPEGSRGIFVGGGGAVRLPRLIGTARMT